MIGGPACKQDIAQDFHWIKTNRFEYACSTDSHSLHIGRILRWYYYCIASLVRARPWGLSSELSHLIWRSPRSVLHHVLKIGRLAMRDFQVSLLHSQEATCVTQWSWWKSAAKEHLSIYLDKGCKETNDAGLKNRGQNSPEIQSHSAQAHAAVHAMLQNRRQASTFSYPRQMFCYGLHIQHPVHESWISRLCSHLCAKHLSEFMGCCNPPSQGRQSV